MLEPSSKTALKTATASQLCMRLSNSRKGIQGRWQVGSMLVEYMLFASPFESSIVEIIVDDSGMSALFQCLDTQVRIAG